MLHVLRRHCLRYQYHHHRLRRRFVEEMNMIYLNPKKQRWLEDEIGRANLFRNCCRGSTMFSSTILKPSFNLEEKNWRMMKEQVLCLTCRSLNWSDLAICFRSTGDKYWLISNFFSNCKLCSAENRICPPFRREILPVAVGGLHRAYKYGQYAAAAATDALLVGGSWWCDEGAMIDDKQSLLTETKKTMSYYLFFNTN